MGHQNQGRTAFGVQRKHQVDDLLTGKHIQIAGWLIRQNQPGLGRKGTGQRHPLLLSPGKMFRIMTQTLRQPHPFEPEFSLTPGMRCPGQFQRQHDVFQRIERRQQLERLKDKAQQTSTQTRPRIFIQRPQGLPRQNDLATTRQIQSGQQSGDWDQTKMDVFSEEFLLSRPLLTAIRRTEPTVLLIDETDKADIEIEGLLLEILSDFAVTVPELGTIKAQQTPLVVLTSNATRELSEALKRRCLFLHIDFPDPDLERRILLSRVPELPEKIADELVRIIGVLRGMQLKKLPSVAETIDWGRTVLALGMDTLDDAMIAATLGVVLKHQSDQQRAAGELKLN